MKKLSVVQFDGITFGMNIDAQSKAYKNFKKHITNETVLEIEKERIRKETSKEILDKISKNCGGRFLAELYKEYGVEVDDE